jgi:hypothetical protein
MPAAQGNTMRLVLIVLALMTSTAAVAKDRATFLKGQYATAAQCEKLRKVEAGGAQNVGTTPELLDADGFHGWEGGCEFTKIYEHDPGQSWLGIMVCSDAATSKPEMYFFSKDEKEDAFVVSRSDDDDEPATYTRCDDKRGS